MKRIVYLLSEGAADAGHTTEVLNTRTRDFLHATELFEQLLPAPRTNSRDRFQRRNCARSGASQAVAGDGKAVRLVAYLLYQVQRRRTRLQVKAALLGGDV